MVVQGSSAVVSPEIHVKDHKWSTKSSNYNNIYDKIIDKIHKTS